MNTPTTSPSANPAVLLERLPNHVALVTINRPEARNAVNGAVATGLQAAVDETEADTDIWVVIITGAGSEAFCAGADLKEVSAGRGALLGTERNGFGGFVYAQRTKPWIAAVNGFALAGGCEISLACDLIVASENAAFGLPEVLRGLIAAAGGLIRLPRAIPPNIAMELILTAGRLDAQRAAHYGLVNQVTPVGKVIDGAIALAQRISMNSPIAVRQSLAVAKRSNDMTELELRELTQRCYDKVKASDDYKEGPLAFIEKRAPRWSGR